MNLERPKTIAEQVNEILRERIRMQTYQPGERLPSESELAAEFKVSRATIRSVLARLAVEGLILRKQGDGTYVNERLQEVNAHFGGLLEFSRLIESSGYHASIQTMSIRFRPASEQEMAILGVTASSEVLAMERVFLADGHPVIFAQNVLSTSLIKNNRGHIDANIHIREFLQQYCQCQIAYAISDIRAAMANEQVMKLLKRPVDGPLLKLKITFYDKNNFPLLHGASYFDDSVLNLRLVQAWE